MLFIDQLKTKYYRLVSDKHFGEILTGSAKVFLTRIIATLIGLGTSVIVARFYGAEIIGVIAIINSFFSIILIFTLLGTNTSILKLIPEYSIKYSPLAAYHLYRKTRILVFSLSLLVSIAIFLLSDFISGSIFGNKDISFLFKIGALAIIFNAFQSLNMSGIRAFGKISEFAAIQLVGPITYAGLLSITTFFFYNKYNPIYIQYFIAFFVSTISFYIIKITFKEKISTSDKYQTIHYRDILKISLPMLLTSSIMIIMGKIDILMIGMMRNETEVGYYNIGFNIAMLTTFLLTAINTIVAPKFSELYHKGKIDELFSIGKKITKLIFWTVIPLLLGFVFCGRWVITNLYGDAFEKSYFILIIISFGLFVDAVSGSVAYFMNMCGHEKMLMNIMFITLVLTIIFNLLLIPKFGIIGAAIATALVKIIWNISLTIFIYKKYNDCFIYIPLLVKK